MATQNQLDYITGGMKMKDFRPCRGGCGRLGIFKGGMCDSCRHVKEIQRDIALGNARAVQRKILPRKTGIKEAYQ
jgi:hypothetical protein